MTQYSFLEFPKIYKKSSVYKNIPDIVEIMSPLREIGVTYFSMVKHDANNNMFSFLNDDFALECYSKSPAALYAEPFSTPARFMKPGNYYLRAPYSACNNICNGNYPYTKSEYSKGFCIIKDYKNGDREIFNFLTHNPRFKNNDYDILRSFANIFLDKAQNLIKKSDRISLPIVCPGTNPLSMLDSLSLANVSLDHNHEIKHSLTNIDYNYCKCLQIASLHNLSNREVQCLNLVIQGRLNKQIAETLGLSQKTTESYIDNIKVKMGCYKKLDLAIKTLSLDCNKPLASTFSNNMGTSNNNDQIKQTDYISTKCEQIAFQYKLSLREIQCLTLIISGKLDKQIAQSLSLGTKTIESYINNIKNKLGCQNKLDVIIKTLS